MVKHATPGLLTLGRDSNNGPIRMITTNTSDAEKRLVTCENKKRVKCIPQLSKRCLLGFLKINFSLFLYLRPSPGRILHRWPRNRCSKWIAGEKRSENVTSTICNEFLVRIHSVVVFLGHQGCKWHRLSKRNNSDDDGIADVLKSTLQIWNLWFWQSIEIILCVHKLVQKLKEDKTHQGASKLIYM